MIRRVMLFVMATAVVLLALPINGASATSTGGCPEGASGKWVLASVEGLGVSPDVASGIASLDGNGDGNTCIRKLHASEGTICNMENPIIFRDNTVSASSGGEPLDCGFGPS
ncbi:MAG TPA: hypothetical protein VFT27_14255 [Actinomycetota bacterium]|nr:hypothetical protein [Actinomycetota bacterium]